ncbi:LytR/AlgR family response regulator transcription factor [Parapedobacter koreensis]|uniref:Two component transcriptional regulator, LytTR family n=1 Tax=Parapedobacter koreensis TaxID=332977 RepID=A0A1H7JUL1_9SPHI|nr:LytTR family DNA-binding domain-containing protein [Parapedobacter koreensis]SEK77986.1 two component transcriptional regulator, LytTR family [Parapedobacter koreensis]
MNVLLIEDEELAAEVLANAIQKATPDVRILAVLASVAESAEYLNEPTQSQPDLIFCDIQLEDGLSFEIFSNVRVSAPVIFCTAYDEYALEAFKSNGIDYLLKPTSEEAVATALRKYYAFQRMFTVGRESHDGVYKRLLDDMLRRPVSLLVNYRDKIIPLSIKEIALFYIEQEETYLLTFDRKTFAIGRPLEELERQVGDEFFRVNRQQLVNRGAVKHASQSISRKLAVDLTVPFGDTVKVSKEKTGQFLRWLSGH